MVRLSNPTFRHRRAINSEARKPVYTATNSIVAYGSATRSSRPANCSWVIYVHLHERVSIDLGASLAGRVYHTLNPLSAAKNRLGVRGGFPLALVMLAIEIHHAATRIARS